MLQEEIARLHVSSQGEDVGHQSRGVGVVQVADGAFEAQHAVVDRRILEDIQGEDDCNRKSPEVAGL